MANPTVLVIRWAWRHRKPLLLVLLVGISALAYWGVRPWSEPETTTIVSIENRVWLGTARGAYRINQDKAIPVLEGQPVGSITPVGTTVWLATNRGAYRVQQDKAIPVLEGPSVSRITTVGTTVWLATDRGAYRVKQDKPVPVLEGPKVWSITPVDTSVWLTTDRGAYRVKQDKAIPVLEKQPIRSITLVGTTVWLATSRGAYRVAQDKAIPVLEGPGTWSITPIGTTVWLATEGGAYRVEHDKAIPVLEGLSVSSITPVGTAVWFGTPDGAYRVAQDEDQATPVLEGPDTWGITPIGTTVWLATSRGAYRVAQDKAIPVLEGPSVSRIRSIGTTVWLATSRGAYRVAQDKAIPVLEGPSVSSITPVGTTVWLATDRGAYRVENDRAILVALPRPLIAIARDVFRYVPAAVLVAFVLAWATSAAVAWRRELHERRRLAFEVEQAKQVAEGLFPSGDTFTRPGIDIAHRHVEATSISGDFYNFITRGDGSVAIYFVDVEGHGLAAALQAQALYQVVSERDWGLGDAREELERADDLVSRSAIFQKYETALCMNFTEIDPEKMEIRHANAGMPFPLLFREGEAQPHPLQAAGVYVGAGYTRYPVKPERVDVKVGDGDLLVIASDGILEARARHGRLFGQKGITAAVSRTRERSPREIADEILSAVREHAGKAQPDDDQTLVIARIGHPIEATGTVGLKTPEQEGVLSLVNGADDMSARLDEARQQVRAWAAAHGFSEGRGDQIWLATWEAIQNAVKYGSRPGDVVRIRLVPPDDDLVAVEVRQSLLWEDWDEMLGIARRRDVTSGQFLLGGTVLMIWLADEVRVSDLGRRITLRFSQGIAPERRVVPDVARLLSPSYVSGGGRDGR